jgi:DNA-directed RNA polymerase subunit K/omega
MGKRRKLTKAERVKRDARHERVLANARRTRELAERAQAALDSRQVDKP